MTDELRSAEANLIGELVDCMIREGLVVHGALGVQAYSRPRPVANTGFGDGKPCTPHIVAMDPIRKRIVFGVARADLAGLESEESLTQYHVLLDHAEHKGDQASLLYIIVPRSLQPHAVSLITHNVHRAYWHRVVTVVSDGKRGSEGE
jgi:hypothetical protein